MRLLFFSLQPKAKGSRKQNAAAQEEGTQGEGGDGRGDGREEKEREKGKGDEEYKTEKRKPYS